MTREELRQPVTVTLSLLDWLVFAGWTSAHVGTCTPTLISAILRQISEQAAVAPIE